MQGPVKRPADVSLRKKVAGRFIVFIVGIVTQRADAVAGRCVPSFTLWKFGSRVLSFPRNVDTEGPNLMLCKFTLHRAGSYLLPLTP
jgi:hypothetical protein